MDALFKKREWLLPVTLILFLLVMLLVPFAAEKTYAGRKESPDHLLTYTTGNLVWDSGTDVNAQTGVAELRLFSGTYENVESDNGEKVVAPGTEGKNIIRLKNDAGKEIEYTAVMYRMKEEDTLPVEPVLVEDNAFSDTENYPLPDGVSKGQVVRAVTGIVKAEEMQDFDITWLWKYDEDTQRDVLDTALGNKAAWDTADEVKAGIYIVVTEEENTAYPQVPQTGDDNHARYFLLLTAVSGVILMLLFFDRRKEKECRKF